MDIIFSPHLTFTLFTNADEASKLIWGYVGLFGALAALVTACVAGKKYYDQKKKEKSSVYVKRIREGFNYLKKEVPFFEDMVDLEAVSSLLRNNTERELKEAVQKKYNVFAKSYNEKDKQHWLETHATLLFYNYVKNYYNKYTRLTIADRILLKNITTNIFRVIIQLSDRELSDPKAREVLDSKSCLNTLIVMQRRIIKLQTI